MLHFYLDAPAGKQAPAEVEGGNAKDPHEMLARCVEASMLSQLGHGFREEDLLARGGEDEWFVFLVSPPRSKQGLTRRDLQEVERRVARELRASIRDALPRVPRSEMPPLRSGSAVLDHDPELPLATQLEEARYEARLHGRVSRLLDDQISGLNHKIRTPLTTVKGVIEIIRHDPDAAPRFLSTLEHEVDRIHSLLKQFSLLTRIESGLFDWTMQEIDLAELLHTAVSTLQSLARDYRVKLTIVQKASETGYKMRGCVEIVEEAVRQIVDNAVRHGSRGKQVRVTLKATRSHVTLQVADRGPGIPEDDLPHIFQPFYVVGQDPDTQAQGGGLGLCLARGVMEVHGGEITCESRPERGTTVTMRFPRRPAGSDRRSGCLPHRKPRSAKAPPDEST